MVALDGFFAGPNGELDWHVVGMSLMMNIMNTPLTLYFSETNTIEFKGPGG